jgi:hypothetical protein
MYVACVSVHVCFVLRVYVRVPEAFSDGQEDSDGDGLSDAEEAGKDSDKDGIPDSQDNDSVRARRVRVHQCASVCISRCYNILCF